MTPSDIHQLVESLCCGDESAFHTLIEGDKAIIPLLIQQFTRRTQGVDRARIIEVIWQFRDEATIPFLASALRDPYADVWKNALDGLVAIGGIESQDVLSDFRAEISTGTERAEWTDEALGQVQL